MTIIDAFFVMDSRNFLFACEGVESIFDIRIWHSRWQLWIFCDQLLYNCLVRVAFKDDAYDMRVAE